MTYKTRTVTLLKTGVGNGDVDGLLGVEVRVLLIQLADDILSRESALWITRCMRSREPHC